MGLVFQAALMAARVAAETVGVGDGVGVAGLELKHTVISIIIKLTWGKVCIIKCNAPYVMIPIH